MSRPELETVRSIGWIVARGCAQALEFLAWIVFARSLGPSAVSLLAIAAIAARLLGLLGDWGATRRGPRDVAAHGRGSPVVASLVRRREFFSVSLAIAMGIVLLVAGRAFLLPISLVVVARGANRDWIALGEGRRTRSALPLLVQGAVVLCLAVVTPATVAAGAFALGVGNAAGLLLSRCLSPVPTAQSGRSVAVDAWYLLAGVADQVTAAAGTVLLLVMRNDQQAGVYNTVNRLPLVWLTGVGLSVIAAIPRVTRLSRRVGYDTSLLHRKADQLALVLPILVVPIAGLALIFIEPVLGPEFESGRNAMLLLFGAAAITTASAPYRVLIIASGSDRLFGLATVVVAGSCTICTFVLSLRWGMAGAALGALTAQLVMLVVLILWSVRNRHYRPHADGALTAPLGST